MSDEKISSKGRSDGLKTTGVGGEHGSEDGCVKQLGE
jgi:hypothetical protein